MKKSRITTLIVVIPLLAMAAGSVAYLTRIGLQLRLTVPKMLSGAVSNQFNGSVQFSWIGVGWSGITVHNLVIADSSKKPIVTTPVARIGCDYARMAKSNPVAGIKSVELLRPRIFLERRPNGRWNVQELVKPTPPGKPSKFGGRIHVKSGRLIVTDRLASLKKPVENTFADLDASVDCSEVSVARYCVSGRGPAGRMGRFTARGQYDLTERSLAANADVENADAAYWTKYPVNIGLDILSGKADATTKLSKIKDGPLTYSSAIRLRDGSIRFKPIGKPITNLVGDVSVRRDTVGLKLNGRLESSPFLVVGKVSDFKHPKMALDLAFDRINTREVVGMTPWARGFREVALPRDGRLKAFVSGPPKSFAVEFAVDAPSLAYKEYGGRTVHATGRYFDRRIDIRRATAIAFGGSVQAKGDIDFTRGTRASFSGKATRVLASELPFLAKEGLVASSDGDFTINARKGSFDLDYRGSMDGMSYAELEFDQGRIDCSYSKGIVLIKEFSAKTAGGSIAVSGSIGQGGEIDLQASGSGINLAEVSSGRQGIVGRAEFSGKITGSTSSPVFDGEVGAERVMMSGIGIERISGRAYASRDRISLENLAFYDYPGSLTVSGTIMNPLSILPSVDISIKADALNLGNLSESSETGGLETGLLFGDLNISGTTITPRLAGNFHIEGASYHDLTLDSLMAKFRYDDHGLTLDDFRASSGAAVVAAKGAIAKDGEISAEFHSDGLPLERFESMFKPYAVVSGSLSLKGSVAGTLADPSAKMEIVSAGLTVNGQTFTELMVKASADRDAVVLSDVSLSDGKSRYEIPEVSYGFKSKIAKASLRVQDGSAAQVLALMDKSPAAKGSDWLARIPRPLTGTINILDASGTMAMDSGKPVPDLHAEVALDDMRFGTGKVKSIRMAGNWKGDKATLEKLVAIEGDTNLSGHGSLGPGDAISLYVDARNLSMDIVREWMSLPDNFSGIADVTVVADGSRDSVSSKASVEIVDPIIGGAKFDRLSGILTADNGDANGRINISDLTLTLDNHDLKLTGYLPVDWKKPGIPRDRPISLLSHMDADALAILSEFTKIAIETPENGKFEGLVEVGGTLQNPGLSGSIVWDNGEIRWPKLQTPLQGITARMILAGDRLEVDRFTGSSPEGGTFSVTGTIAFPDLKPALDLGIKTSSLKVSGKDFSDGYGESVKVTIDSDVKISEAWRSPLISGSASINEGSVSIPGKAPKPRETRVHSMDPRFDLSVELGKKMRLDMATLKTPLVGSLAIGGSLSDPVINGSLDISGGTVILPMRQFKILPGSTLMIGRGPTQHPLVQVDMRAQTKLTVPTTLRHRERYTVTMIAQGPIDKLQTKFDCSPPGLSESEMVALVTGQSQLLSILAGEGRNNMGAGLSGLFSTAMMPTVFAPIEQALESSLGLEEFALEGGYREPLQLTIGQHLWDGLYVDYSTVLGQRPDYADTLYELTLSYRFRHGIELNLKTDENRNTSVGVAGRLRF